MSDLSVYCCTSMLSIRAFSTRLIKGGGSHACSTPVRRESAFSFSQVAAEASPLSSSHNRARACFSASSVGSSGGGES